MRSCNMKPLERKVVSSVVFHDRTVDAQLRGLPVAPDSRFILLIFGFPIHNIHLPENSLTMLANKATSRHRSEFLVESKLRTCPAS